MVNFFQGALIGKLSNIAIALVSAILLIFNVAKVDTTQKQLDTSNFNLIFAEEFDGDALNTSIWRCHNSEGIRKGGFWDLGQVTVADGNLHIKTQYKDDGQFGAGWYTGAVSTQGAFEHTYGYYETRCILPKGAGLWSAFWLNCPTMSNVNGNGKDGTEIDIFESPYFNQLGAPKVTHNLHYDGYGLNTRYKNVKISALDNNPYENYNTYGMLWTAEGYTFYINGYKIASTNYGGVSEVNEYPILSCEIDGADGKPSFGWSGKITNNHSFTADFIVDYVHVYDIA